ARHRRESAIASIPSRLPLSTRRRYRLWPIPRRADVATAELAQGAVSRLPRSPVSMIIAKVAVPSCAEGVARERLFATLDAAHAPVTWIGAPPGAGKTTLAASYLRTQPGKRR